LVVSSGFLTDSKTLAPIYEELADTYSYAKEKVVVAKVDADAHRELGQRFGVTGTSNIYFSKNRISYSQGALNQSVLI
jgi:protein disulfide-isomerase A6